MIETEPPPGTRPEEEPLDLALEEAPPVSPERPAEDPPEDDSPGPLLAAATAWADLVLVLAVCAAAVAGVRILGLPLSAAVLPWACGLGTLAWTAVTAVLLPVRRSWPGALLLGLVLPREAGNGRVLLRLGLTLLAAATLGLTAAALADRDPWSGLVPEKNL